jgi:hypothetical protein
MSNTGKAVKAEAVVRVKEVDNAVGYPFLSDNKGPRLTRVKECFGITLVQGWR